MRSTGTILDRILARKREEVASAVVTAPLAQIRAMVADRSPARDFAAALATPGISVIAEIKRGSPSAGAFAPDLDVAERAKTYESAGAAAISVLTDRDFFQGAPADLRAACAAAAIPVLRKDFIIDPYQVYESRLMGADAILIIIAAMDNEAELLGLAGDLGLHCLVEVHDEHEIERATAAGAKIVGVNNRDLRTFEADIAVTERLGPHLPEGALLVSESGIKTPQQATRLAAVGMDAILVGESLVRAGDPAAALRGLREAGNG
ncbi:MAG: indole-3-glycerol phosphate synthase TrpC [Chloroflexota bacterium]|jgi:indole-3-glycerol phosphate synthase|nr:indole-3-glycerol phosphate synthase TrpC [Chloroflexota bacterium]MDP6509528.1 indole-3-glycerol phosphate synthase TrpC [Chloroflexota bacterium]MDP6758148.1 indole-3-glycerol phosphate synthase TrpC [Chloroflexota bacterium]